MIHGSEVIAELRGERRGGIPWMAILDQNGHVLSTADGPNGNIGYPGTEVGIAHFLDMVRSTSDIEQEDLTKLEQDLIDHKPF